MGKMRSSSISYFNFSSYSTSVALFASLYSIYFVLISANVNGFDSVIQLPTSASVRNTTRKSETLFDVGDFGAIGDGITDDTNSFKDAWDKACSSASRSKIVIPGGYSFLVRPLNFAGPCRSKVSLRIAGTILAPKDLEVWDGLNPRKWLYFRSMKHLTIEGGGTINGMGQEWWARSCKVNKTNPCQHAPTALTFHRCNNLKVRNIEILNSQQMHLAFTDCKHVAVSHLAVLAPADSPNTDGIHISSSTQINIKDCTIGTGDDCISIVGNSSRIKVRNIVCGPGHGISIGSLGKSNSMSQVYNVHVNGASISNTENGVRIKTWQGGTGFVRKITFESVWMENVSNPIIIDQYYCDSLLPCSNKVISALSLRRGSADIVNDWPTSELVKVVTSMMESLLKNTTSNIRIDSISFVGIKGTSATEKAITVACSDSCPCRKLYLEDVQLTSFSGDPITSFCWEAYGSSSGLNYPPPCFSCNDSILQPTVLSNWSQSI